jgi:ferric-dicitrate binding protein FerR (iron transport regulator)
MRSIFLLRAFEPLWLTLFLAKLRKKILLSFAKSLKHFYECIMKEEKYWILLSKKLTGEATAGELELLDELTSTNPEWKSIMENMVELWHSKPAAEKANHDHKAEDAYLVHINRLKEKAPDFTTYSLSVENNTESAARRRPFYKHWITYACAAIVAIVASLYPVLVNNNTRPETAAVKNPANEISINPGSRTKIVLPDGSQVWINSGSKLTYNETFKGTTRDVQLDGEAYFDVVKDAAHPFIVHTSGIDIKVLGTAFNVKAYKAEPVVEATLIHGSIEVINQNRPGAPGVMLKPHEKLIYKKYPVADDRDQRADVSIPAEPDSYSITIKPLSKNIADTDIPETAWVYNKLSFEDERFEDLALKMERWYDLKIEFENESLKDHRVSGSFVNETAAEALNELRFLVPFKYTIKNKEVKIMRK